jgi:hypothetical protein
VFVQYKKGKIGQFGTGRFLVLLRVTISRVSQSILYYYGVVREAGPCLCVSMLLNTFVTCDVCNLDFFWRYPCHPRLAYCQSRNCQPSMNTDSRFVSAEKRNERTTACFEHRVKRFLKCLSPIGHFPERRSLTVGIGDDKSMQSAPRPRAEMARIPARRDSLGERHRQSSIKKRQLLCW